MRHPRVSLPPRLVREPWVVLVPLLAAQWVALAIFAVVVRHNGWLFYQGGDQTYFYTSAWVLGHGHIPEASIGFGWSYLLAPIPLLFGANFVSALPALVLFQVVVLLPVALCSVYGIAARLGGRAIGYFAAVLWVVLPFLTIPLWNQRYHAKYVEQFLPQAFGFTGLGDFPSMVALLASAFFVVRALDTRQSVDAALAGLLAGFAFGIKPVNVLFLLGPALAFALARRFRVGGIFAGAVLPGLFALVLWKYRGLGHLPAFTPDYGAYAAGADPLALGSVSDPLSKYADFDWYIVKNNLAQLREFFWSPRALEWVPVAGLIAAGRRSIPIAGLLGGWLAAFLFVRLGSPASTIEQGTFLRLFMPGFPPLLLLAASIPLLVPRSGLRLAERFPARTFALRWRSPAVIAAWIVLAALPILLFAVLRPLQAPTAAKYFENNTIVPVDDAFDVEVTRTVGGGRTITWQAPGSEAASVFYRVFRSQARRPAPDPSYPPGHEGIRCLVFGYDFYGGASDCRVEMDLLGTTRGTQWVDRAPLPPGRWTYRVGLAANWRNDPDAGDVMLISAPATIAVGR
jgi:hypothetical protein